MRLKFFVRVTIGYPVETEDEFPREYRQLSQNLPIKALLGEELDPLDSQECEQAKAVFFHDMDLCNEQVFLRQNGRISCATWVSWRGGIKSNLQLPAFQSAWKAIKQKTAAFAELKRLERSDFTEDPIDWGTTHLTEKEPRKDLSTGSDSDRKAA